MKKLIILIILFCGLIHAEEYQLYRDDKTGIVYTEAGTGRTKINVISAKSSEKKEGSDVKETANPEKLESAKNTEKSEPVKSPEKSESAKNTEKSEPVKSPEKSEPSKNPEKTEPAKSPENLEPAKSPDENKKPSDSETKVDERKLRITGRIQARTMTGQEDSNYSNGHSNYNAWDTNFRRLRFGFNYQGASWWGGTLDVKLENLLNESYTTTNTSSVTGADGKPTTVTKDVRVRDSRGGIQEANIWLKAQFLDSKFYIGSHRLRFLREDLATSANLLTPERAFAVSFLHQWDIGTFLDIHPLKTIDKKYTHFLKLSGAVTSGRGTHEGYGRQRDITETRNNTSPLLISPMLSWRIEVNPFGGIMSDGKMGEWKEGEEIFQRDFKLSLGMSGVTSNELRNVDSFDSNTRITTYNPNGSNSARVTPLTQQTTATGGDYNSLGQIIYNRTDGVTNYNRPSFGINAHTYDFTATWKSMYANGASTFFTGSAAGGDTRTHHLTLGYNIPISKYYLMPLVRYDFMKGDFNRNRVIDDNEIFKGYWVGLNFFGGDSHNFKVQLFYNILRDREQKDYITTFQIFPGANRLTDANNNIIYFQVQVSFGENVSLK